MPFPSRKTNRQVLLIKPESSFNVDALPDAVNDAILCEDSNWSIDFVSLERNNVKSTWSKDKHAAGRKLAKITFTHEVRSNGKATGLAADECDFGMLLRMTGMRRNLIAAPTTRGPFVVDEHDNLVTFGSITSSYAGTEVVSLHATVTVGGASGTAQIAVTSWSPTILASRPAAVVTSGSAFTLASGVTVTPTFTGTLAVGQSWTVHILPVGMEYIPTSDTALHTSCTIYLYKDGNLHVMTGCFGTMSGSGEVNAFGKASFEFWGQYYEPIVATLPASPNFEKKKPAQIELARFAIDGVAHTVSKFSFDLGSQVLPRLDANYSDGYNGTYIGDRDVKGGIDPEATLVTDYNFWKKLAAAVGMPVNFRFGTTVGNTISVLGQQAQYTNLTYQARDKIQTYDAGLAFRDAGSGDDEIRIFIA